VRPNRVVFKYLDFKIDVDLNVHVKVFNSVVKVNAESFKEYIINAFNYMLRDMTSDCAIITCKNFTTIFFRSLHMHFANVIKKFKMTRKYTWS
jgi:hypothetical protein